MVYLRLLPLVVLPIYLLGFSGCASGGHASEPLWEAVPQVKASSFYGAQNAWIVTRGGDLWRTTTAGSSWEKISGASAGGTFYSVSFIDARRGWAVGTRGIAWRTEDGGRIWNAVGELKAPEDAGWVFMGAPQTHFTDEKHGWIIETLGVWRSVDGGLSWKQVLSITDQRVKGQPVMGSFIGPENGVIGGTGGELYLTADGGQTWQVKSFPEAGDFRHLGFLNSQKGWVVGSGASGRAPVIMLTENGGNEWRVAPASVSGAAIYSINYVDEKEGWAAGRALTDQPDKRLSRGGVLLHTYDGGESWQPVQVRADEAFFDRVSFLNRQQGWLLSRDNVYRTDDAGATWRLVLNFSQ